MSYVITKATSSVNEITNQPTKWDCHELYLFNSYISVYLAEGTLGKVHPNKRDTERYVFLLDGLLICCKQVLCPIFLLNSDWSTDRRLDEWTDGGLTNSPTDCSTDWWTDQRQTNQQTGWPTHSNWSINPAISCQTDFLHLRLQNTRHSLTGPSPEYRLKEKYFLRKIEINNLDDTEGNYHTFGCAVFYLL